MGSLHGIRLHQTLFIDARLSAAERGQALKNVLKAISAFRTRTAQAGMWIRAMTAGMLLGFLAQVLRQIPGVFMSLGASISPWVMVGFLLAVSATRRTRRSSCAILVGTRIVATYLVAWLVAYHLLFVVGQHLQWEAGWREALPWLVAAVPACPMLGTVANRVHKRGFLGDVSLAVPMAWSWPEAFRTLSDGGVGAVAVVIPVIVFVTLLIRMVKAEGQIHATTLITATVTLGALAVAVFPVVRYLIYFVLT